MRQAAKEPFIQVILDTFDYLNYRTVVQNRYRLKLTYEDFYKELVRRHTILDECITLCSELEVGDIKGAFDTAQPSVTARDFFVALYRHRESIPAKHFIDRCEKVVKFVKDKDNEDM